MNTQKRWKKLYKLFRITHTCLLSLVATSFLITGLVVLFTVEVDDEGNSLTWFQKLFDSTAFKTESLLMTILGAVAVFLTSLYGLRWIIPYWIEHNLVSFFENKYEIKLNKLKMWWDALDLETPRMVNFTGRLEKLAKVINFKKAIEMTEDHPDLQKKYLKLYKLMEKYHIMSNITK